MEYLIVVIVLVIVILVLKKVFNINFKEMKKMGINEKLDNATKKYPDNKEICKWYLKKLNNESVEIEENMGRESCLYIAVTNKILIANMKNSFTRIQTIAHECLHSIQGKRLLMFNFVFSNIYLLYFIVTAILAAFNVLPNNWLFLGILAILSMVYLCVRVYLENDAMIKAPYLAKEYMQDVKISSNNEIEEIFNEYNRINPAGIKGTNFQLFFNVCVKIIIFSLICFVRIVAF
ncbi:MAG: hypothetical protein IJH76_04080 [Clostridia bacterium]|nr:hypothetical protein [Clostridia bacterium]